MKTTEFDIQKIDDELLNRLRSELNSVDPKNRVIEQTINITTTTSKLYLVNNKMNYIKDVTLNGVQLKFGRDYEIIWRDVARGSIELFETPNEGLDLIVVYGEVEDNGSFIYPDFPRNDISLAKMPRVGFRINYNRELVGGDGGHIAVNNPGFLQIKVVVETTAEVNKITNAIDNFIFNNFKNFHYIRYIDPSSVGNFNNFNDNTDKPFERVLEYNMPHKYQIRGEQ